MFINLTTYILPTFYVSIIIILKMYLNKIKNVKFTSVIQAHSIRGPNFFSQQTFFLFTYRKQKTELSWRCPPPTPTTFWEVFFLGFVNNFWMSLSPLVYLFIFNTLYAIDHFISNSTFISKNCEDTVLVINAIQYCGFLIKREELISA